MTPERLAQIKALPRPGTPGPWEVVGSRVFGGLGVESPSNESAIFYGRGAHTPPSTSDATFIAAAPETREALDELVAEVERLRNALELIASDANPNTPGFTHEALLRHVRREALDAIA